MPNGLLVAASSQRAVFKFSSDNSWIESDRRTDHVSVIPKFYTPANFDHLGPANFDHLWLQPPKPATDSQRGPSHNASAVLAQAATTVPSNPEFRMHLRGGPKLRASASSKVIQKPLNCSHGSTIIPERSSQHNLLVGILVRRSFCKHRSHNTALGYGNNIMPPTRIYPELT